ncbi:MAG: alpha/beta fold hydrolase [Granulosicoccaceae bacterium]
MRFMISWVCRNSTPSIRAIRNNDGAPNRAPFFVLALSLMFSTATLGDNFPAPASSFDQYISDVYQHIKPKSLPRTDAEIRLNLPFQLSANPDVSYRGRFLLFHGLNDSPYVWRDIAAEIAARGFDVRAILFEGHGSTPVEMLDVSYKSWLATAQQHKDDWFEPATPLYLGGFSLGGVIATLLALEQPDDIAGLLLISPAYHSKLNNYLRWSGIYSKFKPWMFGGMIIEDNPIKYNSIPINSAAQYYKTSKILKRRWRDRTLDIPVLLVASANDSVVDVKYTQRLFNRRFTHQAKKMLLYYNANSKADTKSFIGPTIKTSGAIEARNANFPSLRIINQSHLSLINRSENKLFGEAGRILVCNGNAYPIFIGCMRAPRHWYGAQHTVLPSQATAKDAMARTTYNPDFPVLLDRFDEVFVVR